MKPKYIFLFFATMTAIGIFHNRKTQTKRLPRAPVVGEIIQSSLKAPSSGKPGPQATQKINTLQIMATLTPAPATEIIKTTKTIKSDLDNSQHKAEELKKLEYRQYKLQKENEFLKRKAGLSDEQIKMVHQKNYMYQRQLALAQQLEKKGMRRAATLREKVIQQHLSWMKQVLGAETFEEYLQIKAAHSF